MNILNPKRNFIVEHDGFMFNYKVPTPSIKIEIDTNVSRRLKGTSLESIPDTTYWYSVAIETLNLCLTSLDKNNKDFQNLDWGDVDDYDFVSTIYQKCIEVEKKFREELKKNNHNGRSIDGNDAGHIRNETVPSVPNGGDDTPRFRDGAENVSSPIGNGLGGFQRNEEEDFNSVPNRDNKKVTPRRVSVTK